MKISKLGNNIKSLREQCSLTQIEFAKILNISNTTLSQYEAGNRVPSDEIKWKIADFFDVSVDFLIGRTEDNSAYSGAHERSNSNYMVKDDYYKTDILTSDIKNLRPESKKDLEKYIQLLKIKDTMDKSKAETSSTSESKIS